MELSHFGSEAPNSSLIYKYTISGSYSYYTIIDINLFTIKKYNLWSYSLLCFPMLWIFLPQKNLKKQNEYLHVIGFSAVPIYREKKNISFVWLQKINKIYNKKHGYICIHIYLD